MNKTAVVTISSHNYLSYGLNCLFSCKNYNESFDLYYLIADAYQPELYTRYSSDINFLSLEQLNILPNELFNLEFKYNIVEFNTCVKPLVLKLLLKKGYKSVIYLDPDIECYGCFSQLLSDCSKYSIIVTPHKTTDIESSLIKDTAFLNNGIYNLGFICVNSSEESFLFLEWWWNKLKNECFLDYEEGMATDQIWLELASTIYEDFYVYRNIGLNVAYWNIHERLLKKTENGYLVNDTPLVFFHFSSLSINCDSKLIFELCKKSNDFKAFYYTHCENVKKFDYESFVKIPYAFSTYSDGIIIPKVHRWLFGYSLFLQNRFENPFCVLDKDCFRNYIRSRHILNLMKPKNKKEKYLYILAKLIGLDTVISKIDLINVVKRIGKMIG